MDSERHQQTDDDDVHQPSGEGISATGSPRDPVRGFTYRWNDGFEIALTTSSTEIVLSANAAGLISLARHLLTLADPTAPAGSHLHLTADQELTSTFDLILERLDDSGGRNE